MKNVLLLLLLLSVCWQGNAQTDLDLTFGASKADYSATVIRATHKINNGLRLGVSYQFSDYRYRFINARPVSDGFAGTASLILVGRLAESDNIRLDGFFNPGFRIVQLPDDDPQEFENYVFEEGSRAITLDPGLLITITASEKLAFHTGINMHMAFQSSLEPIFEQFPSIRIKAGVSYKLAESWALFATGDTGPMSGASGDSEKYFWQLAFGLRYRIGATDASHLHVGF